MSAATVRTVGRAGAAARPAAPARSGAPRTAGSSRATTRPTSTRPAASRPAEGPRRTAALRLVPQASSRVARAPFIGIVVGLLALGLLGLLALNTSLAENSFQLHALQGQAKVLADQEQVLRQEVEALQAPEALAGRAEALGMVPGGPPAFLRLSDGKVLGKPSPAPAAPGLGSVPAGAPGPAAPTASAVEVPAVAATPAPERLLARAPVESEDSASSGERAGDGERASGDRTDERTTGDSTTGDSRTGDSRTGDSRTDDSSAEDRAAEEEPVDDGAVDDGATDADADADADDRAAADASTSTGDRR